MGRVGCRVAQVIFLGVTLVVMGCASSAKEGRGGWTIVTGREPAEVLAGQEIAKYVERMTGTPVAVEQAGKAGAYTIEIGKLNGATGPESYEVVAKKDRIAVLGGSPAAELHGAYAFLEAMGCRFLAPRFEHYRGSSEVVPRVATLEVPEGLHLSGTPAMKFRKLYVEEGHTHTAENLKQLIEWMPKGGYNTLVVPTDYQGSGRVKWDNWRKALTPELQKRGITIEVGGHGYQNFINAEMNGGKLFERHPEWFGMDNKGERRREKARVFCTSNADAVKYLADNFVAYVKERPEIQIFDFWPPDGARWCECAACRKLGTPSDRQAILLRQVKEAVAGVRPDLRLEIIAYSSYVNPPEHEKVDPSVLVDFCPISQQFDHQIDDPAAKTNASYAAALAAWRKAFAGDISIYSYYRKYAWDSMPVVIPHYMQHDLRWYAGLPVQGVSVYSEPGDWFTYELNHYVLGRLGWDPNRDVDVLVKEFAEARYGPTAAPASIEAYRAMEDVVRVDCTIPNSTRKPIAQVAEGEARLAKAKDAVEAARQDATDEQVKYSLTRLLLTLDYAIGDLRVQQMVARKDPGARDAAVKLYDMLQAHQGEGVVVTGRIKQDRLLRRLGVTTGKPAAE